MSESLPDFLRQLSRDMTLGDPVAAARLLVAAKEIERFHAPVEVYWPCERHLGMSWTMKATVQTRPMGRQVCPICHPPGEVPSQVRASEDK